MARANRRRLFRLPRRADQQPGAERVSIPRPGSLASAAMSAQPKSKSAMDAHDETGRRVPPPAASPASLAECALRRQTPEVGAECPNWARSELSGGRSETSVPTGNTIPMPAFARSAKYRFHAQVRYHGWPRRYYGLISSNAAMRVVRERKAAL